MAFHVRALGRVLGLSLLLALPAAWAGQTKYPGLVAFGDSLSDTGNVFLATGSAVPPSVSPHATYWKGRFSNGPVAVEYLWRLVARKNNAEVSPSLTDPGLQTKPALSFAVGGSTSGGLTPSPLGGMVPGLQAQVAQFGAALGPRRAPGTALYMVWSGANDYLQPVQLQQPPASPSTVVANVTQAIRELYRLGARDFLVPNLADMGNTPFAAAFGAGTALTQQTKAHNALLKVSLAALERELRHARIVEVDVFKLGAALLSTGLVSADTPALEYLALTPLDDGQPNPPPAQWCLIAGRPLTCPDAIQPGFLPPFLFWDVMHPTTQVHGVLGTAMFAALLTQR